MVSGLSHYLFCHVIGYSMGSISQGMQAQITKAVLSQALLFMSKEQFEHWALAIMILIARLQSKQIQ